MFLNQIGHWISYWRRYRSGVQRMADFLNDSPSFVTSIETRESPKHQVILAFTHRQHSDLFLRMAQSQGFSNHLDLREKGRKIHVEGKNTGEAPFIMKALAKALKNHPRNKSQPIQR